jgi:hypothetical protein
VHGEDASPFLVSPFLLFPAFLLLVLLFSLPFPRALFERGFYPPILFSPELLA